MSGFVRLDSPLPNGQPLLQGSGYFIGDNLVLTAGHVVYTYNESLATPALQQLGSITPSDLDIRGYKDLYEQEIGGLTIPRTAGEVERRTVLRKADTVFVERNGEVDSDNAGIIVFLDVNDIVAPEYGLSDDTDDIKVLRDGVRTDTDDVALSPAGAFFTEPFLILGNINGINSTGDNTFAGPGDSGGAVRVQFEPDHPYRFNTEKSQEFILGNLHSIIDRNGQSGNAARGEGRANYFTFDEFTEINSFLDSQQILAGNVTDSEPTNLIIGSADANIADGSFRADIILGRDGIDILSDGDNPFDINYADDQLFGGAGDDTLKVGAGNDLIHGGDFRDYGSGRIELAADGVDTVDFGGNGSGIQIRLPGISQNNESQYSDILGTDVDNAILVTSVGDELTGELAYTNTLVSIEKIKGTEAADTLFIDSLGEDFLATLANATTGVGGVAEIDLLGDPSNGRATGADGINFSQVADQGVTVDLRDLTNQTIVGETAGAIPLKLSNIENVVGTAQGDTIYAIDPVISTGSNGLPDIPFGSVIGGGGGDDVLHGGAGYDYLSGGEGADIIHLGFGDTALGGAGDDTFHLSTSTSLFNNVTILDFNPLEDTILIDGNPMAGFAKTTTTVDLGFIPEDNELVRIDYKIQQTAGSLTNGTGGFASGGDLAPLIAVDNGEIDRENPEVTVYQDGRYRDIIVSSANGVLNSGRVTYIDANLTFPSMTPGQASRRIESLATGVSSGGNGLSSVSVNSYLGIFFGNSGGFQNSLFSHTMDGVDPNESSNSGLIRSGELRFGRILSEDTDSFVDGVVRTGFEADGLTTGPLAIAGDPNNPSPQLNFQTGPVQVSTPSNGSNQLVARFSRPGDVSSRPSFKLANGNNVNIVSNVSSLFVSADGGRFANTAIELSAAKAFDAALLIRNSGLVGDGNDFNLTTVGLSSSVAGNFRTAPSIGGDLIGTDGGDFLLGSDLNDNLYTLEIGAVGTADVTDLLVGGLGDDIYNVNSLAGRVLVADGLDGTASGGGQDRLIVGFAADTLQVSATSDNKDLILSSGEVGNNAELVLLGQIIGNSANQIETVEFSDGVSLSKTDLLNQVGLLPVAIADFTSPEDEAIDFTIADGGFFDPLSRNISVSATLADGSALPAWLEYSNGRLTGTPPTNFNGQLEIELSGTAGADTASLTFGVTIESVNDAPIVNAAIPDQDFTADQLVDFVIAESSFVDVDGDDIFLTASLSDGSFLPDWLDFDGSRFVGTAPEGFNGAFDIAVTADDDSSSVSDDFILTIEAPTPATGVPYSAITNIAEYDSFYMVGASTNDAMFAASSSNNTNMVALGGNDLLISESSNSSLQGRDGVDVLVIRNLDARVYGDAEGDQYGNVTGSGNSQSADYFVFDIADYVGPTWALNPSEIWATVKDYSDGNDKIAILNGTGGVNGFGDLTITQNGANVDISTPTIPKIVLENTLLSDIDASDFIFGDGSNGTPTPSTGIPYPSITNIVEYDSFYMAGASTNDAMFAASSSNNTNMVALGGNDLLISESWNSSLQGREGTDILIIRAGGIRAYGDAEGDQYDNVTGPGSTQSVDYFVFDVADYVGASYELDPLYVWADIKDYADGVDKIAILNGSGGANSFADLTITQNGTSVDISTPTIPRIVLENTVVADIDASDFIFGDGLTASTQSSPAPQAIIVDNYSRYERNFRLQAPVEGRFREPGMLYSEVPELNALRAGLDRGFSGLERSGLRLDSTDGSRIFDYYEQLNKNGNKQSTSTRPTKTSATSDLISKEAISVSNGISGGSDALKIALMTQDMNMFGASSAGASMKMRDRGITVMEYFAA